MAVENLPKSTVEYFPPVFRFSFIPFSPYLCRYFRSFSVLFTCMSLLLCSQLCNGKVSYLEQQMPSQNRQRSHPFVEWFVWCVYGWSLLKPRRNELEEQVRFLSSERQISNLIHYHQRKPCICCKTVGKPGGEEILPENLYEFHRRCDWILKSPRRSALLWRLLVRNQSRPGG